MIKGKPGIRLWKHTSTRADSAIRRTLSVLNKHRISDLQGQIDLTKLLICGKNSSCGNKGSKKPENQKISIFGMRAEYSKIQDGDRAKMQIRISDGILMIYSSSTQLGHN